ncbi:hypothetical protein SAV14893_093790 [Streptomyces avermitilis]|uniref:Uncharacterized protein n=1 Tax=Streptomyces avermitilis TaxID=33903 RepID=A0A4D4MDU7_STRAX|nr:hypothetical protein SAVMC3_02650 [Streptomyces avermitilis]GDY69986.1 hypothetical protein SAV14893_093790 [Streptomyces avermitilis]GDY80252.1 hypothetical protein SAV31267_097370 [Streptomyces avermitilis]
MPELPPATVPILLRTGPLTEGRWAGRPRRQCPRQMRNWGPGPRRDLCLGCDVQEHIAVRTAAAPLGDRIHPLPPPPRQQLAHLKAVADGDTMQERPCRLALYRHRAARSAPGAELVILETHLAPSSATVVRAFE